MSGGAFDVLAIGAPDWSRGSPMRCARRRRRLAGATSRRHPGGRPDRLEHPEGSRFRGAPARAPATACRARDRDGRRGNHRRPSRRPGHRHAGRLVANRSSTAPASAFATATTLATPTRTTSASGRTGAAGSRPRTARLEDGRHQEHAIPQRAARTEEPAGRVEHADAPRPAPDPREHGGVLGRDGVGEMRTARGDVALDVGREGSRPTR